MARSNELTVCRVSKTIAVWPQRLDPHTTQQVQSVSVGLVRQEHCEARRLRMEPPVIEQLADGLTDGIAPVAILALDQ